MDREQRIEQYRKGFNASINNIAVSKVLKNHIEEIEKSGCGLETTPLLLGEEIEMIISGYISSARYCG